MDSLFHQAQTLLTHGLGLARGEVLLILTDGGTGPALCKSFHYAALAAGSEPYTIVFSVQRPLPIQQYCHFVDASLAIELPSLPNPINSLLRAADAAVMVHSDLRMFLSKEMQTQYGSLARTLMFPYLTDANAARLLPRTEQEAEEIRGLTAAVGATLDGSREVVVTSSAGTEIRVLLSTPPTLHDGVAAHGGIKVLPAGQVAFIPASAGVAGRLVIDRTIAAQDYKVLTEPIVFDVEQGTVTNISGGREARLLEQFLLSFNDERVFHVTELAVGTNRLCTTAGIGAPIEDTHTLGIVSFALGCDLHIGGTVPAPVHIDMTMWMPTLAADGRLVLVDGKIERHEISRLMMP